MKRELDHYKNRVEEMAHNLRRLRDQNLALLENENHYAETIKSLRAAIARKDEALKPFAVAANAIPAILSDDNCPQLNPDKATITVGHCRAAKRALELNI